LVHYFRNETHAKAGYRCSLPDLRRGSWSEVWAQYRPAPLWASSGAAISSRRM